ncbi:DUF2474 domain-containing protein [Sphingomonas sp. ID1715]|nr:DUF2474 domain-containing protein [Sphingomonas sp. ID1715]NNM75339.1 DUF2474 domain-containing protein [Sphingomonas sp. ID1715]
MPRPAITRLWLQRIGWFAAIWAASVLALGVVALVLRWWIT